MNLLIAALLLLQPTDLEKAGQRLADQITAQPDAPEKLFHKEFLKDVPGARLTALFTQLHGQYGEVTSVELVADDSPTVGTFHLVLGDRTRIAFTLGIERAGERLITGLRFDNPRPVRRSIDDAVDELKKLRGKTSLLLARLGDAPLTVAEHEAGRPLAVGSTFKLYILGALLSAEGAKDARTWARPIELRDEHRSLGSGTLDAWKTGSPLTLHSLATLMISQSDNTATDHLLAHAGRERVEKIATEMGQSRNVPFLSTLEAFKLKSSAELRRDWTEGDEAARRALLAGPVKAMKRDAIDVPPGVAHIDQVEWFATAQELCGAMDWLRRKTADPALAVGRDILAVNPGLRVRRSAWTFVGYKGGSEPGVLNLTYLLRSSRDEWFAISASWNDTRPLDTAVLLDLVQDMVYVLQRR